MAVRRTRPAQFAVLPRPVFTETTRALVTPARYASPGRRPNRFRPRPVPGGPSRRDSAYPGSSRAWGGFDDVLDGTGTAAGGRWTGAAADLRRGPGTGRRGAQVGLRRRAADQGRVRRPPQPGVRGPD